MREKRRRRYARHEMMSRVSRIRVEADADDDGPARLVAEFLSVVALLMSA